MREKQETATWAGPRLSSCIGLTHHIVLEAFFLPFAPQPLLELLPSRFKCPVKLYITIYRRQRKQESVKRSARCIWGLASGKRLHNCGEVATVVLVMGGKLGRGHLGHGEITAEGPQSSLWSLHLSPGPLSHPNGWVSCPVLTASKKAC